ncbi:hypothetical protein QRB41_26640 [Mycobacterium avium subsp. hominissuis]|uniref:Uncharacterized protein n=1 Tax=Mycobacterium avium TaxID=1764 RepID=A0A2A2ZAU5_MYCAV|nr:MULTISPECIES: hypothetical protein [Mycobacteriaceae]MDO2386907.1 hypothetical protein [Mycobacterium avium subsp. hominissuis]MDO2395379.1 hypothetical protein [Mycobacterium avium subsp. hominissuis]PBA23596.1 hypothetical protein CKJ66_27520 [Mycobacterium avium]RUP32642.1 MAG: hypothetical protein EKK51_09135 [Mycolicibacterium sp.]
MSTATLFAPKIRYTSTGESQFDAMATWRAELELAYLEIDGVWGEDTPDVLAGYADFLILNVGEHPIFDLLDSLSADAEFFADLFDDDAVDFMVQDQFDAMPFNRVMIITMVDVAAPLRGHDLGAWLVAETIARMASPTDTLVLLYPHPAGPCTDSASELAGTTALSRYWQRVGLEPINSQPDILGQSTAYTTLQEARALLSVVDKVEIGVPTSQLIEEPRGYVESRHTVIT